MLMSVTGRLSKKDMPMSLRRFHCAQMEPYTSGTPSKLLLAALG